jgi:hypothetical protein
MILLFQPFSSGMDASRILLFQADFLLRSTRELVLTFRPPSTTGSA